MKILNKMERATIWILGAFKTSPIEGMKAIAGIIPIKFHLQKLAKRFQMRPLKLPTDHIIRALMEDTFDPLKTPKPSCSQLPYKLTKEYCQKASH